MVDRTHCTRVDNCMPDTCDLRSCVIQGSTIGPLLFISFINELVDLFGHMFVTSKLFADDLKVYAEVLTTVDRDLFPARPRSHCSMVQRLAITDRY